MHTKEFIKNTVKTSKYIVYVIHEHTLTQCFHSIPFLGGGFVAKLTAYVVESKENMMLLMDMNRKLDFNL